MERNTIIRELVRAFESAVLSNSAAIQGLTRTLSLIQVHYQYIIVADVRDSKFEQLLRMKIEMVREIVSVLLKLVNELVNTLISAIQIKLM